jgi:hypothetical protein
VFGLLARYRHGLLPDAVAVCVEEELEAGRIQPTDFIGPASPPAARRDPSFVSDFSRDSKKGRDMQAMGGQAAFDAYFADPFTPKNRKLAIAYNALRERVKALNGLLKAEGFCNSEDSTIVHQFLNWASLATSKEIVSISKDNAGVEITTMQNALDFMAGILAKWQSAKAKVIESSGKIMVDAIAAGKEVGHLHTTWSCQPIANMTRRY